MYGIVHSYDEGSYASGILSSEDFEVAKKSLKSFERMPDFDMIYISGGIQITYKERTYLERIGTKVILSNSITNALTWFDTERDSLFFEIYNSQMTANQKIEPIKESMER